MLCVVLCATTLMGHTDKRGADLDNNPLMGESTLPFGAPDLNKIKTEHFLPAMEAGIEEQHEAIKATVDNKDSAIFENTILAYEKSGVLLDRVTNIFFGLTSADRAPELERVENETMPLLTDFDNEISLNQPFSDRVKYVYDHEYDKLQGEDGKLLEEAYKNFVRSGVLLSADKKKCVEEINNKIAGLQQDSGNMLPKATNEVAIWVDKAEGLVGLNEVDIA